jgi:hypothetical protein
MADDSHVFRWDLDKTYLRTEFDTVGDLLKSAFETAIDKQAYPGATALLRALYSEGHRICIISGSPSQMRSVLAAKLRLDGIKPHEFVLKNNLGNLMRGRFRALRAQVPYKLPALLASRAKLAGSPRETLLGDDAEADAIIYSLYADIVAGKVSRDQLTRIMAAARAYDDEIQRTLTLAARVRQGDHVERVLIHLDRRSPTARFAPFGRRLVPVYNYFQAALVLYEDRRLSARQVLFVATEMLDSKEYQLPTLANSLQDLLRRGRMSRECATRLAEEASEAAASGALADHAGTLPPFDEIASSFATRVRQLGGAPPLEWPDEEPALDYVALVDDEHHGRRKKKRRLFGAAG